MTTGFAAALAACSIASATAAQQEPLTWERYRELVEIVTAGEGEESPHAWQTMGWHADLASGVAEARRTGRPVLLWIMNGHPAGFC